MSDAFEIIDSHIHYWQPASPDRPWAAGANAPAAQPVGIEQILRVATDAGVDRVVQVVPTLMGWDNRYAFEAAYAHPDKVLGVFARVDPFAQDLHERVRVLRRNPKFIGVRLTLLTPDQQAWMAGGQLDALFASAAEHRFPIAIFANGMAREIQALVRRHPDTRFIVDHMALHARAARPFDEWAHVLAMAELQNAWIKASYFPEVSHGQDFPYRASQRMFGELVGAFGAHRVIWGTNYPPSGRVCGYRDSLEFMKQACSDLPETDRARVFGRSLRDACWLPTQQDQSPDRRRPQTG